MGNVPIASNDPIFINHHSMVDYILEQWFLSDYEHTYQSPDSEADRYQGHRFHDCLVPFIPLYTHEDMFKPASEFGYEYESPAMPVDEAIPAGPKGNYM